MANNDGMMMAVCESESSSSCCRMGKPRRNGSWMELHAWFVSTAKDKEADVLFIGGDHVALLSQSKFYLEQITPLHSLCFGSFGDTVENLLWRVKNGEMDGLTLRAIVVSIGQSDTHISNAEFSADLKELITVLNHKQPGAEVFFMELLPSGRHANDHRKFASQVNNAIRELLKGRAKVIPVEWTALIDQNEELDVLLSFDFCHLSQLGYTLVFAPVLEALRELLL